MARRFNADVGEVMEKVQRVAGLEILDGIMEELFAANTLEEAQAIMREEQLVNVFNKGSWANTWRKTTLGGSRTISGGSEPRPYSFFLSKPDNCTTGRLIKEDTSK